MINSKAGIRIIQWLCWLGVPWAQYRVEDKCSNLVLVQIATLKQNYSLSPADQLAVTSYSQLVDNLPLVIGGHGAPVLAGVLRAAVQHQQEVSASPGLHAVLTARLSKKITISSRLDLRLVHSHWSRIS